MAFWNLTQPIGCQVIRRRPGGPELRGRDRGVAFETAGPLRVLPSCRDDGLIGTLREVQFPSGAVGLVHERTLARALPRLGGQQIASRKIVAGSPSGGLASPQRIACR